MLDSNKVLWPLGGIALVPGIASAVYYGIIATGSSRACMPQADDGAKSTRRLGRRDAQTCTLAMVPALPAVLCAIYVVSCVVDMAMLYVQSSIPLPMFRVSSRNTTGVAAIYGLTGAFLALLPIALVLSMIFLARIYTALDPQTLVLIVCADNESCRHAISGKSIILIGWILLAVHLVLNTPFVCYSILVKNRSRPKWEMEENRESLSKPGRPSLSFSYPQQRAPSLQASTLVQMTRYDSAHQPNLFSPVTLETHGNYYDDMHNVPSSHEDPAEIKNAQGSLEDMRTRSRTWSSSMDNTCNMRDHATPSICSDGKIVAELGISGGKYVQNGNSLSSGFETCSDESSTCPDSKPKLGSDFQFGFGHRPLSSVAEQALSPQLAPPPKKPSRMRSLSPNRMRSKAKLSGVMRKKASNQSFASHDFDFSEFESDTSRLEQSSRPQDHVQKAWRSFKSMSSQRLHAASVQLSPNRKQRHRQENLETPLAAVNTDINVAPPPATHDIWAQWDLGDLRPITIYPEGVETANSVHYTMDYNSSASFRPRFDHRKPLAFMPMNCDTASDLGDWPEFTDGASYGKHLPPLFPPGGGVNRVASTSSRATQMSALQRALVRMENGEATDEDLQGIHASYQVAME